MLSTISVGQTTFDKSLNCLRPRGYMVLFGQSSGPVAPFNPQILNAKGSLFLTRPTLGHYIATRDELLQRAGDVLGWIAAGQVTPADRLGVPAGPGRRGAAQARVARDLGQAAADPLRPGREPRTRTKNRRCPLGEPKR